MVRARRDGGKNKDCSELHDAIFAPVVTQGRNLVYSFLPIALTNKDKLWLVPRTIYPYSLNLGQESSGALLLRKAVITGIVSGRIPRQ